MGIEGFTASLKIKPDVKPVFQKTGPIPYSLVENVKNEYVRLIKEDILYPVVWTVVTGHHQQFMCPNQMIR